MNLCEGVRGNLHEEIVHGERVCPLCEQLEAIRELRNQIIELKKQWWLRVNT